jgi:N-methylhydantoinase A
MVASGGAGPLHAVAIARELHIPTVIVPRFPAHFSALGMLMADERQDFIRTNLCPLDDIDFEALMRIHRETAARATQDLKLKDDMDFQVSLDLRYIGQQFALSVPVSLDQIESGDAAGIRKAYDDLHELRYAHHAADEPVEMVNYRLAALGKRPKLQLPDIAASAETRAPSRRKVCFDDSQNPVDCPVYDRPSLAPGDTFEGPALVQEYASTTVIFAADKCRVADTGELIITVGTDA